MAVVNGALVGLRLCGARTDVVFWNAVALVVVGIAMTVQAALKMEPKRGEPGKGPGEASG